MKQKTVNHKTKSKLKRTALNRINQTEQTNKLIIIKLKYQVLYYKSGHKKIY